MTMDDVIRDVVMETVVGVPHGYDVTMDDDIRDVVMKTVVGGMAGLEPFWPWLRRRVASRSLEADRAAATARLEAATEKARLEAEAAATARLEAEAEERRASKLKAPRRRRNAGEPAARAKKRAHGEARTPAAAASASDDDKSDESDSVSSRASGAMAVRGRMGKSRVPKRKVTRCPLWNSVYDNFDKHVKHPPVVSEEIVQRVADVFSELVQNEYFVALMIKEAMRASRIENVEDAVEAVLRLEPRGIRPMVARKLTYFIEYKVAEMSGVHHNALANKVTIDRLYEYSSRTFTKLEGRTNVIEFTLAHDDESFKTILREIFFLHAGEAVIPAEKYHFFLDDGERLNGGVVLTTGGRGFVVKGKANGGVYNTADARIKQFSGSKQQLVPLPIIGKKKPKSYAYTE